MSDAPHYSVRQLADALELPESTVRYYRDTYAAYMPVVGTGSRRLYPDETLKRLRVIRNSYEKGLRRSEIEARLTGLGEASTTDGNGTTALTQYSDTLAAIIDGEREGREAMWQVAREIVRLGEVVERQQVMLGAIAREVGVSEHVLPLDGVSDGNSEAPSDYDIVPVAEAATIDGAVEAELATLREQLDRERELVERLRRSKVEMERRAATAEALLEENDDDTGAGRQSILRRLLLRNSGT
jgi:DNA-binding transcriptional MerR regulator